ncbi:hypothetical protein [Spirosoma litoris]
MKTNLLAYFFIWTVALGCSPKTDPLPVDTWADGCIELAPYQGAYRLTGVCCEYITLPDIKLDSKGAFATKGTYSTFTGAGFADSPILIQGQLAPNGAALTISYTVNATLATYTLKPGKRTMACLCGCD